MIVVQAGHENIQSNCEPAMRSSTGAPGEITWTPDIANRVVDRLGARGVAAEHVDANFNCLSRARQHQTAVVAVHYQAYLPTASGFYCGVGYPDEDGAAAESRSLADHVTEAYHRRTGLTPRPGWDNANIGGYYLFRALEWRTPFVLIECGVGASGAPDHDLLYNRRDVVAGGIADGILAWLGVAPLPAQPTPPEGRKAMTVVSTPRIDSGATDCYTLIGSRLRHTVVSSHGEVLATDELPGSWSALIDCGQDVEGREFVRGYGTDATLSLWRCYYDGSWELAEIRPA